MSRRILIVEDDVFTGLGMADILTFAGFEIIGPATRVAEALELGAKARPDVAIFDIRLAGSRDGIEGAELLRRTLGVPVVFVSATANQETKARAKTVGPVAYLSKPCAPRQLLQAVRAAVKTKSSASDVGSVHRSSSTRGRAGLGPWLDS